MGMLWVNNLLVTFLSFTGSAFVRRILGQTDADVRTNYGSIRSHKILPFLEVKKYTLLHSAKLVKIRKVNKSRNKGGWTFTRTSEG